MGLINNGDYSDKFASEGTEVESLCSEKSESSQLVGDNSFKVSETAKNIFTCVAKNKSSEGVKEFFGKNVKIKMECKGETLSVSVNVNKLARKYGIATLSGRKLVKNVLKYSECAEKTFQRMEQGSLLKKVANNPEILNGSGVLDALDGDESFERLIAAYDQGIKIDACVLKGGNLRTLTNAANNINTVSLKTLKILGKGSRNRVDLAWIPPSSNSLGGRFVALRMTVRGDVREQTTFKQYTNKGRAIYEQLEVNLSKQELDLVEGADELFVDNPGKEGEQAYAVRALATDGDLSLSENQDMFRSKPKTLVGPLLKQLLLYKKSGIGMGDVKPANINIHRNAEGRVIPKFSDVDGGMSVKSSSKSLFNAREALKNETAKAGLDFVFVLCVFNNGMDINRPDTEFKRQYSEWNPESQKVYDDLKRTFNDKNSDFKEVYNDLKREFSDAISLMSTDKYTFGATSIDSGEFGAITREDILYSLNEDREVFSESKVEKSVSRVVNRIQKLDIKSTGVTFVESLLGAKSYKKYGVDRLLQEKGSPGDEKELLKALNEQQKSLPEEDRLPEGSTQLIVDMVCSKVSSDEPGSARIQEIIEKIDNLSLN
jgi:hypothetical protein